MANELTPVHFPGDKVTAQAGAAIVGKTCVAVSAARQADGRYTVATAAAAADFFGVAAYDAAVGEDCTIWREGILPITAGAAITAGAKLALNASGQVVPQAAPAAGTTVQVVGVATDDAASGEDCPVAIRPSTVSA